LPRLIGFERAADWIANGVHQDAATALTDGAIDKVAEQRTPRDEALEFLRCGGGGGDDYAARRQLKRAPLMRDQAARRAGEKNR
jgi:3-hydroxyacyl-CoA dehydrogenase/enoyl-CoA hydratase/3-hydroxybutyryl-CoA epimerase/enoyl-CoA isomerase